MAPPPEATNPDEELARRFRAGEDAAFDPLMEALQGMAYRVAYRVTRREADALDAVQEAFIRVYRRIGEWDGRAKFSSWLYRVVTNTAIDRIRQRERQRDALEQLGREGEQASDGGIDAIVEGSETDALRGQLSRAIALLPEGQRVTVVLRHYEGRSLQEIAEIRGCALGTVKSTLHQAFQRLKEALAPPRAEGMRDAGS